MQKRRKSHRLSCWDYRNTGYYFVTICTENRRPYFGKIVDDKMCLNHAGKIVEQFWTGIPDHFENVATDTFVVMPNHVHGIIQIHKRRDVALQRPYTTKQRPYNHFSRISPKPKSLSAVIRSFKSIVTKTVHKLYPDINFKWQSRFHDHIIRNERSLQRIRTYIQNNPLKWKFDKYHANNQKEGCRWSQH